MTEASEVLKMTSCPKCALEFKTLLHNLCLHDECPAREADRMRSLAEEGMRQGRSITASVRVWEYEDINGKWRECRNADDACMWAEDGRRIREKAVNKQRFEATKALLTTAELDCPDCDGCNCTEWPSQRA